MNKEFEALHRRIDCCRETINRNEQQTHNRRLIMSIIWVTLLGLLVAAISLNWKRNMEFQDQCQQKMYQDDPSANLVRTLRKQNLTLENLTNELKEQQQNQAGLAAQTMQLKANWQWQQTNLAKHLKLQSQAISLQQTNFTSLAQEQRRFRDTILQWVVEVRIHLMDLEQQKSQADHKSLE